MIEEREFTAGDAKERLHRLCAHFQVTPEVRTESDSGLSSTCRLIAPDSLTVGEGAGKGIHSELGALAESLEHYALNLPSAQHARLIPANAYQLASAYRDEWLVRSLPGDAMLPVVELQALGGLERLWVPNCLITPNPSQVPTHSHSNTTFLTKYGSNSGTALGCSESEACLHALNECIERHALSVFYLACCKAMTPPPFFKLPANTVASALERHSVAVHYMQQLDIYMTGALYGRYVCLAVGPCADNRPALVGAGCSADGYVAIYRAVTEHLQCAELHSIEEEASDQAAWDLLTSNNGLYNLVRPALTCPVKHLEPPREPLPLDDQIKHAVTELKRCGRRAFMRTLLNVTGMACVVQVYIPGLERFHLIRNGIPVASQSALSSGMRDPDVYL